MTVRLRAHHLLCMLAYVGRGYSPAFTANYDRVVRRIGAGEPILLVEGPDDICAPLFKEEAEPHCLRDSVRERDRHAAVALSRLLDTRLAPGASLDADRTVLAKMRTAFAKGRTRRACVGCQWSAFCSAVATDGYGHARLPG